MRRRQLCALLAAAGSVMLVATSCGSTSSSGSGGGGKTLTFVSTGSIFQDDQKKAWQDPYTKETGTKFRNDSPVNRAKLKTMVESGNVTWDVMDEGPNVALEYCDKYLEKLDFTVIDKSKYPPDLVSDCGVPDYLAATLFMYDTSKFGGNPPTTLGDFFDIKKYPGKRSVSPVMDVGMFEIALMADGVKPENLYPLDIERALRKFDAIKKDMVVPASFGQLQQSMETSQVVMALASTARAYQTVKKGAPWAPVWDKTMVLWNDLMVPKNAPNKEEAMRFIAFVAKDPQQKLFSELETVGPISEQVKPDLNEAQNKINAFTPQNRPNLVFMKSPWWAENTDAVTKKWQAWMAG